MQQIKILTGSECYLLLEYLQVNHHSERQRRLCVRNHCMALLMLDAGLRVGEVCKLQRTSLLFAGVPAEGVVVTAAAAKNHRERTIPMSGRLKEAVGDMNDVWWHHDSPSPEHYAFYATRLTVPLRPRQVQRIIKAASMSCLQKPVHPHLLRHTFATRLMKRVNIRIVQELLGHKQLSSTQVYTHPNSQDLKDAIVSIQEGATDAG